MAAAVQVTLTRRPRPNVPQPLEVATGSTVADALRAAGEFPDAVIVVRAGAPLPLDARLEAGDRLDVVKVFSGG